MNFKCGHCEKVMHFEKVTGRAWGCEDCNKCNHFPDDCPPGTTDLKCSHCNAGCVLKIDENQQQWACPGCLKVNQVSPEIGRELTDSEKEKWGRCRISKLPKQSQEGDDPSPLDEHYELHISFEESIFTECLELAGFRPHQIRAIKLAQSITSRVVHA